MVSKIGSLTEKIKHVAEEKDRLTAELSELSLHKARSDMELGKIKRLHEKEGYGLHILQP